MADEYTRQVLNEIDEMISVGLQRKPNWTRDEIMDVVRNAALQVGLRGARGLDGKPL